MYSTAETLARLDAAAYLHGLAEFATVTMFDRRGVGWSDPLDGELSMEQQCSDLLAVMDHAGADTAFVSAMGYDAQPSLAFAALHSARTAGVIAVNTTAKLVRADDHPDGMAPDFLAAWRRATTPGQEALDMFGAVAPSLAGDGAAARSFHRAGRSSVSPSIAGRYLDFAIANDVRRLLPWITAPVLVAHTRRNSFIPFSAARALADAVPRATLHELAGSDQMLHEAGFHELGVHVERFVTGRTGRHRRGVRASGVGALTPAERRVAHLLMEGLTNREIAARLGITSHTVKSQVAALLTKTGSNGRTQFVATYATSFTRP